MTRTWPRNASSLLKTLPWNCRLEHPLLSCGLRNPGTFCWPGIAPLASDRILCGIRTESPIPYYSFLQGPKRTRTTTTTILIDFTTSFVNAFATTLTEEQLQPNDDAADSAWHSVAEGRQRLERPPASCKFSRKAQTFVRQDSCLVRNIS